MKTLKIGTAKIRYNKDGTVASAKFTPAMKIEIEKNLMNDVARTVNQPANEIQLKNQADTILASWFDQVNKIELADREKYEIVSNIVLCNKFANDAVKIVHIEYEFKEK